ncbi:L-serine ammonia-lyase, iron-sulfur-dependent, subunit alpha [Caloramator proteoclasticus]|uniref:L-serine dehydratase n=1 Tax=Caloramator proteoclasticus DSM 10124 TaxID=1121262 RepID=A0A1M4WBN5_9CLOT|nr:L-serine ammonia-lyase, iron-sulfur-dependent, subunit alpha [Caloramator proteoclasticus]SHE78560.1 L-serine dehydratase [Caloramator proteoclasticus DSM 10124]
MYNTGLELMELANSKKCKIYEIVIENEVELQGLSREEIILKMKKALEVMKSSAQEALDKEIKSVSGLIGGDAKRFEDYRKNGNTLCGDTVVKAMARALSCSEVNAAMGRIVAAPTAGSCGILPAALITAGEKLNKTEDEIVNALFTASGIGQIIAKNATVSGAEGGCQAECGAAAAMAAAAIVEMAGGTPEMCLNAASIALKNIMGLVCDPIAGLVEAPCAKRNASGVVNALISSELALAGIKSIIPFDEVVEAMYRVGKALPEALRETALGGIAATPTGIKLRKQVLGE